MDELLMIPGPVPLHPRVMNAMAKQMINHRGDEFGRIMDYCVERLKEIFATENDVLIISGSGTAGMEAAVSNFVSGKLVCIQNGKFGERFVKIGKRYCESVVELKFEWGTSIDLEKVEMALSEGAEAVTMVHNETSTGILNPAREVAKLAEKYDALFILDAITSAGGDEVRVDDWGVDVAVVGSQKCLGAPPGISAVAVSERAWSRLTGKAPYYLDLESYRNSLEKTPSQTPYTPALPLFFALYEALKIIEEETMEKRIKRHRMLSEGCRKAMTAMGLELFPELNDHSRYSNTVTAIKMPEGITDDQLRGTVKKEFGVIIAGGQDILKGRIFRIGNMGNVGVKEMITTISAVESVLYRFGVVKEMGRGMESAMEVYGG